MGRCIRPSDGVTPDYFQVLVAPVVAGRLLVPTDHQAGASEAYPVAVISQRYAARRFGDAGCSGAGDRKSIGRVNLTALHPVERRNPLCLAKLLNLKDRDLAERVGFEPDQAL